jgi:hypothetical protein
LSVSRWMKGIRNALTVRNWSSRKHRCVGTVAVSLTRRLIDAA